MEKMDIAEVEENFFAASDAKLHGGMCKLLSAIHCKVLEIFPVLESARPRSKSGIQSLCALHVALERTRNILQHCSESSKLYLAITGDSIILKFEKARSALQNSLSRVEDIVPQSIGCQITEIVRELEGLVFSLDPSEKQVGDEIIALLQKGRKFDSSSNDMNELEIFHRAASRLGITSSRAALTERRALKKLIDRARMEDDKRKESIVAYLLHLMRKYSKLFRSELSDDNDSQGSTPCSPTVQGSFEEPEGNCQTYDRQFSKHSSFNFKPNGRKSGQLPLLPEELRCPISLQLMHDPVIISSGQTYERVCIEKWFSDGHTTCPKTQQHLSHLNLTPNYCVKGLIANWCEQNGVPLPSAPPESLDLNYWRLALSDRENLGSCKLKEVKVVPLEENCSDEEVESDEVESVTVPDLEEAEVNVIERYEHLLSLLCGEGGVRKKCRVVERIRRLLKDDEEARIYMGANGFVEALKEFLESAVEQRIDMAQEVGAMALFNLAVNNNRNKETMLSAGMLPLLEEMIADSNSHGSATALYLTLSCHEGAKAIIGSSNKALPFLIGSLEPEVEPSRKQDALHTLYNLSSHPPCIPNLISHGITANLQLLLSTSGDHRWTEKSVAVLTNLASSKPGKDEILLTPGLVASLATILDEGEPVEQEQVVTCLVGLCAGDEKCSQMVLQEGVIPALVSISVNGTARGKEKAQKLLMLFREQRQREPSPVRRPRPLVENDDQSPSLEGKPLYKSSSKRKMGKAFSFLWKSRNQSMYQC